MTDDCRLTTDDLRLTTTVYSGYRVLIIPAFFSRAISTAVVPSRSRRISSVCSPSNGAGGRPAAERLVGQQRAVRRAERTRHDAVGQRGGDHARENPELAFEHRHVEELAAPGLLARVEGRQDPESRIHAG